MVVFFVIFILLSRPSLLTISASSLCNPSVIIEAVDSKTMSGRSWRVAQSYDQFPSSMDWSQLPCRGMHIRDRTGHKPYRLVGKLGDLPFWTFSYRIMPPMSRFSNFPRLRNSLNKEGICRDLWFFSKVQYNPKNQGHPPIVWHQNWKYANIQLSLLSCFALEFTD